MENNKLKMPEELTQFEQALKDYRNALEEKVIYSSFANNEKIKERKKNNKHLASLVYQTASTVACNIENISKRDDAENFRKKLNNIHKFADNDSFDARDKIEDIESLERMYWSVKPNLLKYNKRHISDISLEIKDNVDPIVKEYLQEAVSAYNANAIRAAIVMSGAAMEKALREIHNRMDGDCSKLKLWQILEKLEKYKKIQNRKVVLEICREFRNFCAHPSEFKPTKNMAAIIIKSVEAFANSEQNDNH